MFQILVLRQHLLKFSEFILLNMEFQSKQNFITMNLILTKKINCQVAIVKDVHNNYH